MVYHVIDSELQPLFTTHIVYTQRSDVTIYV